MPLVLCLHSCALLSPFRLKIFKGGGAVESCIPGNRNIVEPQSPKLLHVKGVTVDQHEVCLLSQPAVVYTAGSGGSERSSDRLPFQDHMVRAADSRNHTPPRPQRPPTHPILGPESQSHITQEPHGHADHTSASDTTPMARCPQHRFQPCLGRILFSLKRNPVRAQAHDWCPQESLSHTHTHSQTCRLTPHSGKLWY